MLTVGELKKALENLKGINDNTVVVIRTSDSKNTYWSSSDFICTQRAPNEQIEVIIQGSIGA